MKIIITCRRFRINEIPLSEKKNRLRCRGEPPETEGGRLDQGLGIGEEEADAPVLNPPDRYSRRAPRPVRKSAAARVRIRQSCGSQSP